MKTRKLLYALRQTTQIAMLKWHLTTLALLLVGYTSGVGQERLQGSAVILGPLQADVSRQVVLSALPEVVLGQLPPFRLPRPQNGLTDEQWRDSKVRSGQDACSQQT